MKLSSKAIASIVIGLFVVGFIGIYLAQRKQESVASQVATAILSGDISACSKFKNADVAGVNYGKVCNNNIRQNTAVQRHNLVLCNQLAGTPLSPDACKEKVSIATAIAAKDANACSVLNETAYQTLCANTFWARKATAENDMTLCAHITGEGRLLCESSFLVNALAKDYKSVACTRFSKSLATDCALFKSILKSESKDARALSGQCEKMTNSEVGALCMRQIQR